MPLTFVWCCLSKLLLSWFRASFSSSSLFWKCSGSTEACISISKDKSSGKLVYTCTSSLTQSTDWWFKEANTSIYCFLAFIFFGFFHSFFWIYCGYNYRKSASWKDLPCNNIFLCYFSSILSLFYFFLVLCN